MVKVEEYYKVFYEEDKILKCARYSYEDECKAIKVADMYSQKENVTNVQVYKYEVVSTLIKQY